MRYKRPTQAKFAEQFKPTLDLFHPVNRADLIEYWTAPGRQKSMWHNKPHRLLYDLIRELYWTRMEINRLRELTGQPNMNPITGRCRGDVRD